MDEVLNSIPGAIPSDWFEAAQKVTGWRAIGAADPFKPNGTVLLDEDEAYLQFVHHELAKLNYDNYKKLLAGEEIPKLEGLRGRDLDYALVELEQQNLSSLTDEFFKEHPDMNRDEILESVSRASDPITMKGGFGEWLSSKHFLEAMEREFETGTYDADNEEHRIRIGKAMIDIIREERERED